MLLQGVELPPVRTLTEDQMLAAKIQPQGPPLHAQQERRIFIGPANTAGLPCQNSPAAAEPQHRDKKENLKNWKQGQFLARGNREEKLSTFCASLVSNPGLLRLGIVNIKGTCFAQQKTATRITGLRNEGKFDKKRIRSRLSCC